MIHILFGQSPSGCLKIVLKKIGVTKEEHVISFWEMFSIGPIWHLQEEIGKEARFDWMKNILNNEYDEFDEYKSGFLKAINQIACIPEGEPITIWIAENSHEQTGLRYVLYLLKGRTNEVKVINTTKLYAELFSQPNIKCVVLHTGEISPEKLQIIYEETKEKHPLSHLEREQFEQEWLNLADNREVLRIWQNGRIQSVPEDYYDQYIINRAKQLHKKLKTQEFMKSARLIGEVLGHLEQYVGDEFLEYRLKKLIEKGVFEVEGSMEAMRLYSVRLKND
ncbi:DUF1835 domain-containing protein [Thermanaerosceptrum fracticalcis]|uniref:DUF1835 domain-containing protein n=1 Tax=Thermanaerosceptrum fracticalcis TaxID=1712410 RepID=A0A7G6E6W3_THEFR|nr:DUF1835 domain-containing protein [Thermanaerosceptrum fracticalcis]QNB47817.1 DUF1835 domain-containing protein [Thermanaerosceptrum fracticalcis]